MVNSSNTYKINTSDPFQNDEYKRVFDELYVPLCRYTLKYVNDCDVAEDLVQDLFVYLWEHKERLLYMESLGSYLYTAAKNRSLNYLQMRYTHVSLSINEGGDEYDENSMQEDGSEIMEFKELEHILEQGLNQLPDKCRVIFSLKRFGGMSNKEIATHLDISVKTVENQMTIALRRMMSYLNEHWYHKTIQLFSFLFNKKSEFGFRG